MIKVKFKKLDKNAVIPQFKHPGDAGKDVIATSCKYNPKYDRFEYGLGFATEIPLGYECVIRPRSSNTKTNAYLPNSVGTVDAGYRGEWKVFYKLRTPITDVKDIDLIERVHAPYKVGDAVAQVMLQRVEDWEFVETDELENSERGSDGGLLRDNNDFKV